MRKDNFCVVKVVSGTGKFLLGQSLLFSRLGKPNSLLLRHVLQPPLPSWWSSHEFAPVYPSLLYQQPQNWMQVWSKVLNGAKSSSRAASQSRAAQDAAGLPCCQLTFSLFAFLGTKVWLTSL